MGTLSEDRLNRLAIQTAYKIGDGFFREVVVALAEILNVSHVMITECLESPPTRVRTLAFFARDVLCENIEYELDDTPCKMVFEEGIYFCEQDVQKTFPQDHDLAAFDAESYGGISLIDSKGKVVGHLCYLNDKEIADSTWQIPPLKLIQARCGAEIERTRLERILAAERKAVEDSKRLASLGTLAAGIAHEINNPLTTIQLLVDLGIRESQLNKTMPFRNLELIRESVESISQIVDGVLRVSNNQETEKVACDLPGIIRRACDLTSHLFDKSPIQIEFETIDSCFVSGNPLELKQVFVNLLSNAIQATKSANQNKNVEISFAKGDGCHVVSIKNRGRTIPPDEQSRIFDPFYTSRTSDGGTGLGLSVSLGIIKALGGNILVQSSAELTEFQVQIPFIKK